MADKKMADIKMADKNMTVAVKKMAVIWYNVQIELNREFEVCFGF